MLVHICCAVDSHYFLKRLKKEFPKEELVGYFYDPNIQPYSEYRLRFLDVSYSCKKLGIKLFEGDYNIEEWLKKVKGLENEPEKGDRCTVCFDDRLETSALKAKELGHKNFTSTLLISPKKSQEKLEKIGKKLTQKHSVEFIFKDYRSGKGTEEQALEVKNNSLYRQNYCGCLFGLMPQRLHQNKLMDEMFSPLSKQVLPESIESRLILYAQRNELESKNIPYKIVKQRFLNYRILSGLMKVNKVVVPSYFLFYSMLAKSKIKTKVEYEKNDITYLSKGEVIVVALNIFNEISGFHYRNVKTLLCSPPTYKAEINIRAKLSKNQYSLSPIIIIDHIEEGKYEIELNAKTYEDIEEIIV